MIVTDGFTGNVFLKVMEGTADTLLRAVRDAATSSPRAKAGGLLLKPALGGLRDAIDPEAQGGAFLLGLRKLGVVPHGSFGAHGHRARDRPRRARGADRRRGAHARAPGGGRERSRDARRAVRARRYGPRPMTRDEVLSYIRAHLADELELDPARVEEGTRFKEDLEADSLDLYSLVQELEDTYGVKMSDEEAARITLGRPGRRLRARANAAGERRAEALTPARAARPAGGAAGGSRPAGGHACLVDRPARRQLRAARAARRLGARAVGHDAPVPAAGRRALRRRAADEDPRAGGLGPLVPGGRRAAGPARAAAGRGAARRGAAGGRGAARDRARARVGDRGGDRRVLPRLRLRADRRGGPGGVRAGDRVRARAAGRLQVGAAGAAGAARRGRALRGDGRDRAAARADVRGRGGRGRRPWWRAAPGAPRRTPSRPRRPPRSSREDMGA